MLVNDYASCTHLAAPRILKTQKFICGLAHAPVILSTDFVDACLSEGKVMDPQDYLLADADGERRQGSTLAAVMARAKDNKGMMLRGYSFYVTETVHGGFDTYKSIVMANGGKCMLYRGRAPSTIRAGLEDESDASESGQPENVYLVSGTTPEEGKLWPRFRQMVEGMGKTPMIVRTEWLLYMALTQDKDRWFDEYSLTDKDVGSADQFVHR